MLLEQIERKHAVQQKLVSVFKMLRGEALEDFRVQEEAEAQGVGDRKTLGLKLSDGVHEGLEKVARKYGLRGKKRAALLALNAGIRALLDPDELKTPFVDDVVPPQ